MCPPLTRAGSAFCLWRRSAPGHEGIPGAAGSARTEAAVTCTGGARGGAGSRAARRRRAARPAQAAVSCASAKDAFGRIRPSREADPVDVGVDRQLGAVVGEEQHAGGGLAPHSGQAFEELERPSRGARSSQSTVEAGRLTPLRSPARISWIRRDLTFDMPPGLIASSTSRSGASATSCPAREARAQPRVGDVAVAVVRVLGQDRQDQLVERRVVGQVARPAVVGAQAVADRLA